MNKMKRKEKLEEKKRTNSKINLKWSVKHYLRTQKHLD